MERQSDNAQESASDRHLSQKKRQKGPLISEAKGSLSSPQTLSCFSISNRCNLYSFREDPSAASDAGAAGAMEFESDGVDYYLLDEDALARKSASKILQTPDPPGTSLVSSQSISGAAAERSK